VANKALLSANPPSIARLAPGAARPGAQIRIFGTNLIAQGDKSGNDSGLKVFVNNGDSIDATDVAPDGSQANVRLPAVVALGPATIALKTPAGLTTSDNSLHIVGDAVIVASANPTDVKVGETITFQGSGFFGAADVDADGVPLRDNANAVIGTPALITLVSEADHNHVVTCAFVSGSDSVLTVRVPVDTLNAGNAGWFDVGAARGGVVAGDPRISIDVHPAAP
jgi:hypothetical protein